jgi:hypothetical protein
MKYSLNVIGKNSKPSHLPNPREEGASGQITWSSDQSRLLFLIIMAGKGGG